MVTFLPRDAMLSLYTVRSLSVCPSVRPSVRHKLVGLLYRNDWTEQNQSGFCYGGFLSPVLRSVLRKLRYLQNKGTFLWSFFGNSGLGKFRHARHVDRRHALYRWLNVYVDTIHRKVVGLVVQDRTTNLTSLCRTSYLGSRRWRWSQSCSGAGGSCCKLAARGCCLLAIDLRDRQTDGRTPYRYTDGYHTLCGQHQ